MTDQVIAVGPAASQIAIKQLGTNGGGFFNVNSSHPFENPTPFSNFLEMLAILLLPAAVCYTFGKMIADTRQGWALLAAMTLIFLPLLAVAEGFEQAGNPALRPRRRPCLPNTSLTPVTVSPYLANVAWIRFFRRVRELTNTMRVRGKSR